MLLEVVIDSFVAFDFTPRLAMQSFNLIPLV